MASKLWQVALVLFALMVISGVVLGQSTTTTTTARPFQIQRISTYQFGGGLGEVITAQYDREGNLVPLG